MLKKIIDVIETEMHSIEWKTTHQQSCEEIQESENMKLSQNSLDCQLKNNLLAKYSHQRFYFNSNFALISNQKKACNLNIPHLLNPNLNQSNNNTIGINIDDRFPFLRVIFEDCQDVYSKELDEENGYPLIVNDWVCIFS